MLALAALLFAVSRPPPAYLQTGSARVPLAISSWCWGTGCGAPIAASRRVAVVRRGATLRAELTFVPTQAQLAVAGRPVTVAARGSELSWRAGRGGGLTLHVTSARGWVTYVGRIRVR